MMILHCHLSFLGGKYDIIKSKQVEPKNLKRKETKTSKYLENFAQTQWGSLIPPTESLDQPGAIGAFYPFAGKDEVKGYGRNNVGVKEMLENVCHLQICFC